MREWVGLSLTPSAVAASLCPCVAGAIVLVFNARLKLPENVVVVVARSWHRVSAGAVYSSCGHARQRQMMWESG